MLSLVNDEGPADIGILFEALHLITADLAPRASVGIEIRPHRTFGGPLRSRTLTTGERTSMPRYFFNCDGALNFDDEEGTELPDLHAARIQAIENAGEILRDGAECFSDCPRWRMTITNEAGEVVFRLHFSVEQEQAETA